MQQYQRDFLDFALSVGVLRFGEFKLKSGRISPYFFNAGLFNTGGALARLGNYYAETIIGSGIDFDLLYGPAYKGIPLAAVTSSCLAEKHNRDLPYAFNRKEAKDHGEGGTIIGSPLRGHKVLIIDDVISAGTSVRESVNMIKAHHATPAGAVIALDRQERGQGRKSAIQEVQDEFGMPVAAIVCLEDLITYLDEKPDSAENLARIEAYRAEYGV